MKFLPSSFRKGLKLLGMIFLGAWCLSAQNYQTNFEAVTYDRGKAPILPFDIGEVEVASGAVSIRKPLGPGIGNDALRFTPVLSGSSHPTVNYEDNIAYQDSSWNVGTSVSMSPGYLDWSLTNAVDDYCPGNYNINGEYKSIYWGDQVDSIVNNNNSGGS